VTTQVARPRTALNLASGVRIDNVSIFDPLDGSVRPQHSIVISGARIEAVIPTSSAATESSFRVIQGNGRFAVPGFNDMHTHVLQEPNPELGFALILAQAITGIRQMEGSTALLSARAENQLGLNERTPAPLALPGELRLPFNAQSVEGVGAEVARQCDAGADFIKMVLTEREIFFCCRMPGLRSACELIKFRCR
jgi:hypothetical protein